MKIILLAAAAIGCGVLIQKVYESDGGLTFGDMVQVVSEGTHSVADATVSVESAARTVGEVATAATDGAARTYDGIGGAMASGKQALDGAVSYVTSGFNSAPTNAPLPLGPGKAAVSIAMPSKPSAMLIRPDDLPPIEREAEEGH